MSKSLTDGLSRLQNQSRIPATSWRQWCSVLKLDPVDAVEVWEEICHPIMVATRQVPEVAYILQLRAARPDLDTREFKAEAAGVLHCLTFLYSLEDERISKGKLRSAILGFYRKCLSPRSEGESAPVPLRQFHFDLCAAVLIAKVLKGPNINLSGVLKPLIEGRGTVEQVVRIALKSVQQEPYAAVVRECLEYYAREGRAALGRPVDRKAESRRPSRAEEEEEQQGEDAADEPSLDEIEAAEVAPVSGEAEPPAEEDDGADGTGESSADEVETSSQAEALAEDAAEEQDEGAEQDEEAEEGEDADELGEDGGEEEDGDQASECLLKFKTSLHAIYEAEGAGGPESTSDQLEQCEKLLDRRLRVIASFDPLRAAIPSMEEAQALARRAEAARSPSRVHKPVLGAGRPAAPTGGGSGPPSAAVRSALIVKGAAGSGRKPPQTIPVPPPPPPPPAAGGRPASERMSGGQGQEVELEVADMVETAEVTFAELDNRVRQIAKALANVESFDKIAWALFLDPFADVRDPRAYSRTMSTLGTPSHDAYESIKLMAQLLNLKNLLAVPEPTVQKERNFTLDVSTFVNNVKNSGRPFTAESKQLAPLKKIIDHAAVALVRLEALRTNFNFAREHPEEYTREAVTVYFEEALRSITDLVDRDLLKRTRDRADADTYALLALFAAAKFGEGVEETCHQYLRQLQEEGQLQSVEGFQTAVAARPLQFEQAPGQEGPGEPIPPDLLLPGDSGELFDAVCQYVCTQAWAALRPVHEPVKVIGKVKAQLRQVMVSHLVLTPERKRHQEKPAVPLDVVSLEKVTGNAGFREYFVRLKGDGQVQYVEGFEDGTHVDVFELREYKPSRMHSAAKKKADEEGIEELQTGRKYLFTVGRTKRLFGDTPSDLINGCIRSAEGGPKVFDVF